ncbi:hypothetical protein Pmani_019537 [Petrolisthes manimaculis]|uniref:RRM domain-containing protein n=1 Tax=Petrolisthes manimaculis TaxID=1843537 RepID=A0AAE1U7A0_9EUCA|nr:hypothetical protein Pmani_019537 [Petrolisthes manimaculis]
MSVIIRLQNLPWSANALDIREFFKGLAIPEGGVHIVGGELGDAFIAFSTDEDARLAMQKTGSSLKGIRVTLLLSSRTQMQKVIETARQQAMALQAFTSPPTPTIIPTQQQQPPTTTQPQHPTSLQQQQQQQHPPQIQQQHPPPTPMQPLQQQQQHSVIPGLQVPGQAMGHHNMYQVQPPSHDMPPQQQQQQQHHHQQQQLMPPHLPPGMVPPGLNPPHPHPHPQGPPTNMSNHTNSNSSLVPSSGTNNNNNNNSSDSHPPPPSSNTNNNNNNNIEKKDDKKTASGSSSSSSRRDSKGRDSRRRRSKSRSRTRSRSRDRDRRRRHRSRTRSRSRDRSGRSRRRSRSRDRDRTRDRNRDRDRDKERDRERSGGRSGRERTERNSQDTFDNNNSGIQEVMTKDGNNSIGGVGVGGVSGGEGIPGLGDIPSASMRGPLPSSLTDPIKNTPIQTPSPGPVYNTLQNPGHNFNKPGQPFNPGMPGIGGMVGMNQPPPAIPNMPGMGGMPMASNFNEPMNLDPPDTLGIIEEPDMQSMPPRGMGMGMGRGGGGGGGGGNFGGGPMRGPSDNNMGPSKGLLGDGPLTGPFDNMPGRGTNFRGGEGMMNHPMSGGQDFVDNFDPRDRQRDPRDVRYKGDMDGREGMMPDNKNNEREAMDGGWDQGRRRPGGDRGSQWVEGDQDEQMDRRGRREGRNRDESKWGGMDDGMNEERYFRDEEFDDGFGFRGGFRGRGGRGMERGGRFTRGGRGFGSRFGGGYQEENGDDGFGFRGGFRGRGNYRGRGGMFYRGEGGGPDRGDETCSVEINNIPLSSSYRAIREFFRGIYVPKTGIKLLTDDQGMKINVAVLQFSSPRDAQMAVTYTGRYIYDNKIEVSLIPESKYKNAVDMYQARNFPEGRAPPLLPDTTCLFLSGLPLGCSEHDVAQIFGQFKIEDIVMERNSDTQETLGQGFIRLGSPEDVHHAMTQMPGMNVGGGFLQLELCPPDAMVMALRQNEILKENESKKARNSEMPQEVIEIPDDKDQGKLNGDDGHTQPTPVAADLLTDSVIVKGVPKDTTEANVRDFFSDEGLVPEKVHISNDNSDKNLRQVYVMFPKIEDARKAVGKSQQQLGKVKVEIEMVAKPLVMAAMGLPFDPLELIRKGQKALKSSDIKGIPDSNKRTIQMNPNNENPNNQNKDMEKREGPNDTNNKVTTSDDGNNELALTNPPLYSGAPGLLGPIRGMLGQYPTGPRGGGGGGGGGGGVRPWNNGGGGGMNRPPMGMPRGPTDMSSMNRMRGSPSVVEKNEAGVEAMGTAIPPEKFGKPGCVVALGNVPYRATTDDIIHFFHEIHTLRPENIIRRYNEFNQPTADARVALRSTQDSQRAIQTLHRQSMNGRQIFVAMVDE